jgi:hypothetical protein
MEGRSLLAAHGSSVIVQVRASSPRQREGLAGRRRRAIFFGEFPSCSMEGRAGPPSIEGGLGLPLLGVDFSGLRLLARPVVQPFIVKVH